MKLYFILNTITILRNAEISVFLRCFIYLVVTLMGLPGSHLLLLSQKRLTFISEVIPLVTRLNGIGHDL